MITIENGIVSMNEQDYFTLRFGTPREHTELTKSNDLEVITTDYLHQKGFRRNLKGFIILRGAIMKCVNESLSINNMMDIYTEMAKITNSTPSRTERNIRHAIESSNIEKITNSEFIAKAADEIRLQMKGDN